MKGFLGIDIARKVRETDSEVRLVFCTASNEFASESYEVNAHYYLRKPFTEDKIKDMLVRLDLESIERSRAVIFSCGQRIRLREIVYTECFGHNIIIHNLQVDDTMLRITQSEAEYLLCINNFFAVAQKD